MVTTLVIATLVLVLIALTVLISLYRRPTCNVSDLLDSRLASLEKSQERTERIVKEEIAFNRSELGSAASEQRQELTGAFKVFGDSVGQRIFELAGHQKTHLESFSVELSKFANDSGARLDAARVEATASAKQFREEVVATLGTISDSTEKKLESLRSTVEGELKGMKSETSTQLEQMRQTVDEKLQGTLEKRLGESFKQVSERLEQVHKGLGEMQSLAAGVGDLKKALTNVKTRGTWGEVQLGTLLEQVLSSNQFARNVSTKGFSERVDYAVKLPGQGNEKADIVWLPIDAKFPVEAYQRLLEAQERADIEGMEAAGKQLEGCVKSCAKEISEKYLAPPKTTDFGILFLPIEGLFAETIRRTGLIEDIQRNYRVVIAGPTTLWSILNSLQMGFRTLAIEKRSSEVWNLLAGVKTEWTRYGAVLDAVQKKLHQASETIETVQVRSRAIGRKLKDVQELPANEVEAILSGELSEEDDEAVELARIEQEGIRSSLEMPFPLQAVHGFEGIR